MRLCECGCGKPAPIAKRTNSAKGHVKGQPVRLIAGHKSSAVRAKIAAAKKGKPRDKQTRAKISAALSGRVDPPEVRAKKLAAAQRGAESPVWVGSEASYNAVHNRARKELPKACAHAGESCRGRLEVALRDGLDADLMRVSPRGYRYWVGDLAVGYMRLCSSHHKRHDLAAA